MAYNFKLSRGAAQQLLERKACKYVQGTDIGFTFEYTATTDRAYSSSTALTSFKPGDFVYILGSTYNDLASGASCSDTGTYFIEFPTGTLVQTEAAGDSITMFASDGGSFNDLFNGGSLVLFGGTQRTRPEDVTAEDPLIVFEDIVFAASSWAGDPNYKATVALNTTVTASAINGGTATWFCLVRKGHTYIEASTTSVRCDGTVSTAGTYDLIVTNDTFDAGVAFELQTTLVFGLNSQ